MDFYQFELLFLWDFNYLFDLLFSFIYIFFFSVRERVKLLTYRHK